MSVRETALVVVVPRAEPVVGELRLELDPSARRGVPAHVTVLYPFVPATRVDDALVERLAGLFAGVPAFEATFPRAAWFGDDVLYLAPEPDAAFRALTDLVADAFPEHPPYGGAFDDVVPHLTVADRAPIDAVRAAERAVVGALPFSVDVVAVTLLVEPDRGPWTVRAAFPLGAPINRR